MYYKVYPFEIEEFLFFCSSLYMMDNPIRKGDMKSALLFHVPEHPERSTLRYSYPQFIQYLHYFIHFSE